MRLIDQFRRIALAAGEPDSLDGQLLNAFVGRRDEAAFEKIVRRHGPMVLGVCRRVLHDQHDAEDAFQATFLVLARKAATVRPRHLVGNWLYGVAHRTALEARTVRSKRRSRQSSLSEVSETVAPPEPNPELQQALDAELSRLPEHYRSVIVLCELEGRTQQDAARQLSCPPGTVASRLARGRALLAKRLARHALTLGAGTFGLALSAKVPTLLVVSTVRAAASVASGGPAHAVVSSEVTALTEGVLKNMLLAKLKAVSATFVAFACIGLFISQVWGGGAPPTHDSKGSHARPSMELPVGKWSVEFANGASESCEIRADGTASVVELTRKSAGTATIDGGAIVIAWDDNRVERWTTVGNRLVVEHWFPANQMATAKPVFGIAIKADDPDCGRAALTPAERQHLTEAWPVITKVYAVQHYNRYTDAEAGKLREFIDPRYLKEHRLTEGNFPMERVVFKTTWRTQVSDDLQTAIFVAETEAGVKELFVFRMTIYDNRIYFLPSTPPDKTTKSFKPWILRMKL